MYKIRTKLAKHSNSPAAATFDRVNYKPKVYKRQIKTENNTKLSYQLNVGLGINDNQNPADQPFAVYNAQEPGNSPIYIAPTKYQAQDPIFNDGNLNDYRPSNNNPRDVHHSNKEVIRPVHQSQGVTFKNQNSFPANVGHHSSQFSHHDSHDVSDLESIMATDGGYDPFFPGFGAKIPAPAPTSSPLRLPPQPQQHVTSFKSEHPRSYFPS